MNKLTLIVILVMISCLVFGNEKSSLNKDIVPSNSFGLELSSTSSSDMNISSLSKANNEEIVNFSRYLNYAYLELISDQIASVYVLAETSCMTPGGDWFNGDYIYVSLTVGMNTWSAQKYNDRYCYVDYITDSPSTYATSHHVLIFGGDTYVYDLSCSI